MSKDSCGIKYKASYLTHVFVSILLISLPEYSAKLHI